MQKTLKIFKFNTILKSLIAPGVLLTFSSYLYSKSTSDSTPLKPTKTNSFNIDSIAVFTGVKLKRNLYTPTYRYQDSLFCNYDTLMQVAQQKKQTVKISDCDSLFNLLASELTQIRAFRKTLTNSENSLILQPNNCHIDGEISDCFELFISNKTIKIGIKSDNLNSCYINGTFVHLASKSKLIEQLLYLRNSKTS